MKIKDLRKTLKNLPGNMDVIITSGIVAGPDETGLIQTHEYGASPRKAKTKLVRKSKGYLLIQTRPQKDKKAKLMLVLE